MPSSNPASSHPAEAALTPLIEGYRARYGAAIAEVGVEPVDDNTVRVIGQVLLARQRDEVLAAVQAASNATVVDELAVLSDPHCPPLAWAMPAHPVVNVRRSPAAEASLSSQALASDVPMRMLWREDDWRLVQTWDHTLGWVHCDDIREVSNRGESHPWEGVRRPLVGATVAVDVAVETLLEAGRARLGQPYLLGGTSAQGLDCSALVQRLYWDVARVLLPKHTGDQRRVGLRVSRSAVEPGDLLFFKRRDENFGHVALALDVGGQQLLHASLRNGAVVIEPFEAVQGAYAYLGARRIARFLEPAANRHVHQAIERVPVDLSKPDTLRGHKVHVLGLAGAEGAAIARFLFAHGVDDVTTHDFSTADTFEKNFRLAHVGLSPRERGDRLRELLSLPYTHCLRDRYLEGIDQADVVFVPQGWFLYPANEPIRRLRDQNRALFSHMTDLYFRLAPCRIAAVTGTNGKSTTTRLLSDLVAASPLAHLFAGNDRRNVQVLDRLEDFDENGLLVLEVSNRQLIDLDPAPFVGVVTNVTPDHIEEHGSFEAYTAVKRKLVRKAQFAILNADDPISSRFESDGRILRFGLRRQDGDGAWLDGDTLVLVRDGHVEPLIARAALPVKGDHNVANVLAASLAAHVCGVDIDTIRGVLATFKGIHLRIEEVATVDGVTYVNDIKSTTPEAALAAVQSYDAPLHLIVGGGDKGLDYERLAAAIVQRARHLIVLESAGGQRVAEAVERAGGVPKVSTVHDLEQAVNAASREAKSGDVVLLSPACPGMFSMYVDDARGFNALVRSLTGPGREERK